jgi:fatty-acyl-CoA synthase
VVSIDHLTSCVAALEPWGLGMRAFTPAYGLAETTLAVSMVDVEAQPRVLSVDPEGLESGEVSLRDPGDPDGRALVSAGRLLPDFTVTRDGAVGELHVSGPSLALGYRNDPEATATRFRDGRFRTGDLGFLHDDELYVVGRTDDRLIIGGRNVDVADLEHEIAEDARIRKGNCAIVDVRSGERQRIVLVAETASPIERGDLLPAVRTIAARDHGLRIDDVVLLSPGQFPKTPSGKPQRYRCRGIAAGALP